MKIQFTIDTPKGILFSYWHIRKLSKSGLVAFYFSKCCYNFIISYVVTLITKRLPNFSF